MTNPTIESITASFEQTGQELALLTTICSVGQRLWLLALLAVVVL